jgi:hypothetical protein
MRRERISVGGREIAKNGIGWLDGGEWTGVEMESRMEMEMDTLFAQQKTM